MPEKTGAMGIGKSLVIKGELSGNEDLTINGRVEGKIDLNQNTLTVDENGKVKAQILAKTVVVIGEVLGNVTAVESVSIREMGAVDGDISSPRVAIAEGAHFRGSIDMRRTDGAKPGAAARGTAAAGSSAAASSAVGAGVAGAAKAGSVARQPGLPKPEPLSPPVTPALKS